MEENLSLNSFVESFLEDEPVFVNHYEYYTRLLDKSIGFTPLSNLTDSFLSSILESAEIVSSSREDLFLAVLFLRTLIKYASKKLGVDLPEVNLPKSVFGISGLTEQKVAILLSQLYQTPTRHALCIYLILRTNLPITEILKLTAKNISLEEDILTITIDKSDKEKNASSEKKAKDTNKEDLLVVPLRLDEFALNYWTEQFLPLKEHPKLNLASGKMQGDTRNKLQESLNEILASCGFDSIPLSTLKNYEWNEEEDAQETFFAETTSDETPDTDAISASDQEITKLPTPDVNLLIEKINALPTPVVEHSKRVRFIASFILEFIRGEDWFLDLDMDEHKILTAVYCHDLGKTALTLEDLYPTRSKRESNQNYKNHTNYGIDVLTSFVSVDLAEYPENSFAGLVRDAISFHHERPNGKGFPKGVKKLPFVGALTSVCDAIDHELFVGGDQEISISNVVEEVLEQSGLKYDAQILLVISEHKEAFLSFLSDLQDYYNHKRKSDAYGLRFQFRPYMKGEDVVAYEAHLFFNDPYYGLMDSDGILPLVEDNAHYSQFIKLEIKRLCRTLSYANENGVVLPPVFLKIAVSVTQRPKFFDDLFKILVSNGIRYHQIIFAIDEDDAIGYGVDLYELAEKFRLIGTQIAIINFGGKTSILPSIDKVFPDFIVMHPSFSDAKDSEVRMDFLKNVFSACSRMGTKVFMAKPVRQDTADAIDMSSIAAFANTDTNSYLGEDNLFKL